MKAKVCFGVKIHILLKFNLGTTWAYGFEVLHIVLNMPRLEENLIPQLLMSAEDVTLRLETGQQKRVKLKEMNVSARINQTLQRCVEKKCKHLLHIEQ